MSQKFWTPKREKETGIVISRVNQTITCLGSNRTYYKVMYSLVSRILLIIFFASFGKSVLFTTHIKKGLPVKQINNVAYPTGYACTVSHFVYCFFTYVHQCWKLANVILSLSSFLFH